MALWWLAARLMLPEELKGKRIAIPGTMTTAYLALKLFQPDFEHVVISFDKILEAVTEHGRWRPHHPRRAAHLRSRRPPQRSGPGPLV